MKTAASAIGKWAAMSLVSVAAATLSTRSGNAASSIGFNFTQPNGHDQAGGVGPHLSEMVLGVDDPFSGLYVGAVGGANYLNVHASGTYTLDGLTMVAPSATSLGNPVAYSFGPIEGDFLDPTKTHPANSNDSAFVRDMYGVAEVDNTTAPQATTFSFSGIPYATYDLYVHALVQSPGGGHAKMTVGGTTFNMYGAGWPIDIARNVRITDAGDGGVNNGTWMVFTNLTGGTQDVVFSDLTARGIIGAIQFVDASAATPAFAIASISMVGGNTVVDWPSSSAWAYWVEYTPSLQPLVPWSNLPGFEQTQGMNGLMSATDAVVSVQAFYRVMKRPVAAP